VIRGEEDGQIKKTRLESDLINWKPASKAAARALDTDRELLKTLRLLIRMLKKSKAKTAAARKKAMKKTRKALVQRIASAEKLARLRAALKRLNKVDRPPRRRKPKEPSALLGEAPDAPPWSPLYDGDAFSGTRGTGGIQEMRAYETPQGGVQFDIGGELRPSISPIRRKLVHPDGVHKPIDYSRGENAGAAHGPGPAANRRYEGKQLRDATGKSYERAHLWGHGFGDEARAGIMYAPPSINQAFQRQKIENFLIEQADIASKKGGKVSVVAKARSHPLTDAGSNLKADRGEMLLSELVYEVDIVRPDGTSFAARYELTVSKPPGSLIEESIIPPGLVDLIASAMRDKRFALSPLREVQKRVTASH